MKWMRNPEIAPGFPRTGSRSVEMWTSRLSDKVHIRIDESPLSRRTTISKRRSSSNPALAAGRRVDGTMNSPGWEKPQIRSGHVNLPSNNIRFRIIDYD